MSKRKRCKRCHSEFVCWNWFFSPFWRTWFANLKRVPLKRSLRFWRYLGRWLAECWDCGHVQSTFFKVKAISHEELKAEFKYLPRHSAQEVWKEVTWLLSQGKYFRNNERVKYEHRKLRFFRELHDLLNDQWMLDHPDYDPKTAVPIDNKGILPTAFFEAIFGKDVDINKKD